MFIDDHRSFCVLSHQQGFLLLLLLVKLDDLHQLALLHVQLVLKLLHLGSIGSIGSELFLAEVSYNCCAKSISEDIHCRSDPVN